MGRVSWRSKVTLREASEQLGVSQVSLYKWINEGLVKSGEKIRGAHGGDVFIINPAEPNLVLLAERARKIRATRAAPKRKVPKNVARVVEPSRTEALDPLRQVALSPDLIPSHMHAELERRRAMFAERQQAGRVA